MKKVLLNVLILVSLASSVFAQPVPQQQQKLSTSWEVIPGQPAANLIVTDDNTKKVVNIKVFTRDDLLNAKKQIDTRYQSDTAFLDSGLKLIDTNVATKVTK